MNIKVIAFDVYGTILMSDDPENCVPAREGFIEFAEKCIQNGIKLVTSSDNGTELVKIDLIESGVPLYLFSNHFRMAKGKPKNFGPIIERFNIKPEELLVFGDRQDLDIDPALEQNCMAHIVPQYNSLDDYFDWMSVLNSVK